MLLFEGNGVMSVPTAVPPHSSPTLIVVSLPKWIATHFSKGHTT